MILKSEGNNIQSIHLEPGETLYVTFDPNGVNAPIRSTNEVVGVSIGTVNLGCEIALSILPEPKYFYEGTYSGSNVKGWYIYINESRPESATFVMSQKQPRLSLELKKVFND